MLLGSGAEQGMGMAAWMMRNRCQTRLINSQRYTHLSFSYRLYQASKNVGKLALHGAGMMSLKDTNNSKPISNL